MQDKEFNEMNQQIERAGCGCMIIVVISLILIAYAIF